jgi:hypothetical protein
MAPATANPILSRYISTCSSYYYDNCSNWDYWGRWVFTAVVIIVIIGILFTLACVNARRRRRRGMTPMYGTGWMGGKYQNGYNNPQAYNPPPPQYSSQPMPNQYTGNTFNTNEGYYGHHEGIQLQQPTNVYNRAPENGYEAPPGPPPSKIA